MAVQTLQDLIDAGVSGRGVLVRADFNVPLDGGKLLIGDKVDVSLTIEAVLQEG